MSDEFYNKWGHRFAVGWLILVVIALETWLTVIGKWYALPLAVLMVAAIMFTFAAIAIVAEKWGDE